MTDRNSKPADLVWKLLSYSTLTWTIAKTLSEPLRKPVCAEMIFLYSF